MKMELGYTIPLQKYLKIEKPLPQKAETTSFFCWDLHLLTVQGRKAVLAMNCNSWYSILLYDMKETDWPCLPDLIESEIKVAILREGLSKFEVGRYFALGGPQKISPPHGPDPAERLNCAMAALIQQFPLLDESRLSQPRVCHALNGGTYDVEGFSGKPREVFLAGFRWL